MTAEIVTPQRWVPCPLCRREWSKLHPCAYWSEEERKMVVTYVCVNCAESVHELDAVAAQRPCPGADIAIRTRKGYRGDPASMRSLTMSKSATVTYGKMAFSIEPQSGGAALKVVYGPESDKPFFADNIFKAWGYISERIRKGEDPTPVSEGWTGVLPFKGRKNVR